MRVSEVQGREGNERGENRVRLKREMKGTVVVGRKGVRYEV